MAHRERFVNQHKFEWKVAQLSRESKLSKDRVKQLLHYFQGITAQHGGKMNRNMFRLEFTSRFNLMDEFTLDNLYRCFDYKNRGAINKNDYIRGMGAFLSDDLDAKTRLAFNVYDLNGDGFITREEMVQWLKTCMVKQTLEEDAEEGLKEMIETVLKKLDCVDHDNKVSYKDFEQAVKNDHLLLESLAPCLAPSDYKTSFLLLISGDCSHAMTPKQAHYRPPPPCEPNYLAVLSAKKRMARQLKGAK